MTKLVRLAYQQMVSVNCAAPAAARDLNTSYGLLKEGEAKFPLGSFGGFTAHWIWSEV